jgi:ABC-type cobalamin/Fe3+-siderophores transport system ATPase subunit
MDFEALGNFSVRNLSNINVLLGKNGCGKSFLLKKVEQQLPNKENVGLVRYISPERGGLLAYEAGVDQAIGKNPNWLKDNRRKNQSENFRQQSASLFRRLELLFLRKIEKEHTEEGYEPRNFGSVLDEINTLLDRVRLERHDQTGFEIIDRETNQVAKPEDISSGESELVSLGIEFLAFVHEAEQQKTNFLLIDEPDVHLHPDLQDRLASFATRVLKDQPVVLIVATHSTALLAGFSERSSTNVSFMKKGDTDLRFKPVSEVDKAILPIFGAHPLSNVFNQSPILLVEGEDDERIWQAAIRSSNGQIRLFPCAAGSVVKLNEYETEVRRIIESVYDEAKGYSLRDRDEYPEEIEDLGPVLRMRLSCRAAENLMLCDEVLEKLDTDWEALTKDIETWIASNESHRYFEEMHQFKEQGFQRKTHDLKEIRNILIGMMTNKPWEIVVGQSIAGLVNDGGDENENSLRNYLGSKVCESLLQLEVVE